MKHTVYVDLSANAEQLSRDSAVAMTDGVQWVCLVRSKAKRYLAERLAARHGSRHLQYRLLAAIVYLAVQSHLPELRQIVIDRDYSGEPAESTIKNFLLALIRQRRPEVEAGFVRIANVKGSNADRLARAVFAGKVVPDRIFTARSC